MKALHRDIPDSLNARPGTANSGLWFDKYCNRWSRKSRNGAAWWSLEQNKSEWIGTVVDRVGEEILLEQFCTRMESLVKRRYGGKVLRFTTDWRFVTGLGRQHPVENGFAWHHTLGVPYLPGSSVKGMVRAWARDWEEYDDGGREPDNGHTTLMNRIFGPNNSGEVGSVIFFDALPSGRVRLEEDIMTPHYGPWYAEGKTPGDWYDPVPIPFLAVAPGEEFRFFIAPRQAGDERAMQDVMTVANWLQQALQWIGAGAKTAVGYGRMTPSDPPEENVPEENPTDGSDVVSGPVLDEIETLEDLDLYERSLPERMTKDQYAMFVGKLRKFARRAENWNEDERRKAADRLEFLYEKHGWWRPKTNKEKRENQEKEKREMISKLRGK